MELIAAVLALLCPLFTRMLCPELKLVRPNFQKKEIPAATGLSFLLPLACFPLLWPAIAFGVLGLADGDFAGQQPVQPLRGAIDHSHNRTVILDSDLHDQCWPWLGSRVKLVQFWKMAPQDVANNGQFPGRCQNRLLTSITLPFGRVFLATRRMLASSSAASGPASGS